MSPIAPVRRPAASAEPTLLVLGDLAVALLCALAGSALLLAVEPGAHAGHEQGTLAQLVSLLGCTAAFALVALPLDGSPRPRERGPYAAPGRRPAGAGRRAGHRRGAWLHAGLHGVSESPLSVLADATTVLIAVSPSSSWAVGSRGGCPRVAPRRLVAVAVGRGAGGDGRRARRRRDLRGLCRVDIPGCLSGGPVDRSYDVTAIDVDITTNRFGDHDPQGHMYALTDAIPAIRAEEAEPAGLDRAPRRPDPAAGDPRERG